MKKAAAFLLLLLMLAGCGAAHSGDKALAPDDTTLEYGIAQDVSAVDLSQYAQMPGVFGATVFYGSGYTPETTADGGFSEPEKYVEYTVTAYPDYADGGAFITGIVITDPQVSVWGLSLLSEESEFEEKLSARGFTVADGVATYKNVTVRRTDGSLRITAGVTNRQGIVY